MYRAKRDRAPFQIWSPSIGEPSAEQITMAADLVAAIEAGEIELEFQPQLKLRGNGPARLEALARWTHPQYGRIPAQAFVAVAERSGLMGALTRSVLDRALRAVAGWRRRRDVGVAVNLSALDLADPRLPTAVVEALSRHSVAAHALTLEITESTVIADTERALGALRALRELGVGLAIDDFGSGYSSLSYLARLPVTEVKLDRSLVAGITKSPRSLAVVRRSASLAHDLRLRIVAEGVETREEVETLTRLGCDAAQGYGIARPLAPDDVPAWLDRAALPPLSSVTPAGRDVAVLS
jgi:EAL domain-containing protein (putative c-di-GMP-specific phosphodiesterase class I)